MKSLRLLGNEIVLGTLIALLSIFTALASWQGSIADSKQNEHEIKAMQSLNDGNAEYLSANQFIVYDYTMYAPAHEYWAESGTSSDMAGQWDSRGDGLQLVMLIMAVGLAFAAWASLLREESNMRLVFSFLGVLTLMIGIIAYLGVPAVIS